LAHSLGQIQFGMGGLGLPVSFQPRGIAIGQKWIGGRRSLAARIGKSPFDNQVDKPGNANQYRPARANVTLGQVGQVNAA
jgi:hypothetical protein